MVLCPYRLFSKQSMCLCGTAASFLFHPWKISLVGWHWSAWSVFACVNFDHEDIIYSALRFLETELFFLSSHTSLFFGKESWFQIRSSLGFRWVCFLLWNYHLLLILESMASTVLLNCSFGTCFPCHWSMELLEQSIVYEPLNTIILSSDDRKLYQLPYFGNAIAIIILPIWQIKPNILDWILIWYYLEIILLLL